MRELKFKSKRKRANLKILKGEDNAEHFSVQVHDAKYSTKKTHGDAVCATIPRFLQGKS